jgi:hypothetical protein
MRHLVHLRRLFYFVLLCCAPAALAQGINEVLSGKPGVPVLVASAKCIFEPVKNSGTALLNDPNGMMRLVFTPDPLLRQNAVIYLELGDAVDADKQHCTNAVAKRYVVNLQDAQDVPEGTLAIAFRVLGSALVLAILLESAFELLFNWRLFQAFFVGKAWRSPIMFAISWLVAWQFKFDVLAPLFDAYAGRPAGTSTGSLATLVLTAMILAGGSVGVNRIMTRMGIRSPFPKIEDQRPTLDVTQAWVSITVKKTADDWRYSVNMSDEALDTTLPAVLGVIGSDRTNSPRSLLFPSKLRVPRSGGITVSVDRTYRISVTDMRTNTLYDLAGKVISGQAEASRIRFAPRAFVDLVVEVK